VQVVGSAAIGADEHIVFHDIELNDVDRPAVFAGDLSALHAVGQLSATTIATIHILISHLLSHLP
jgi:hypothetical protein